MKPLTVTISPEPEKTFTERYGGWILSICFHVMLFSALLMARQPNRLMLNRPIEPIHIRLADLSTGALSLPLATASATSLAGSGAAPAAPESPATPRIAVQQAIKLDKLPPPKPAPAPESEPPASVSQQAKSLASALRPLAFVTAPPRIPSPVTPALAASTLPPGDGSGEKFNPNAGGSTETGPGRPDGIYAAGAARARGEGLSGDGTGPGRLGGGSPMIGGRISNARAELIAQKTLHAPVGTFRGRAAFQGAIREIVTGGAPGDKVKEVFDRYGIKMMASPYGGGNGSISTPREEGEEQIVQLFGSGAVGVFRFSSHADGIMAELADKALRENGYEPARTRVISITFGIVSTPKGYDLGVLHVRTEPLLLAPSRPDGAKGARDGG